MNRTNRKHLAMVAAVSAVSAGFAARASAATDVWTGAAANWNNAASWTGGNAPPQANDILQFAGTSNLAANNDFAAATQFNGINFLAGAGAFTLGGNSVLLGGDINQNSSSNQTIGLGLLLDGATSNVGGTGTGSLSLGQLTLGLAAQSANASTLNVNRDLSLTGLTVQTNSTNANVINIASGKTLTASGSVILGTPSTTSGSGNLHTNVNFTGGGNFTVNTTSGNFFIGLGNVNLGSADRDVARVDMTQLANFTYNTGATGTGLFGVGWMTRPDAQLRLTPGTNTIVAAQVQVGDSGTTGTGSSPNNNGTVARLFLGAGTNIINTNTLGVGTVKGGGTIDWQDASNGSVTIAGQDGVGKTAITVGNMSSGGGGGDPGQILLAGHTATVNAGTVIIGRLSATGSPATASQITFDKGSFTADSLQLGVNAANAATNGAQGTFTLGTVGADPLTQGTLTVNNQFLLGNDTNTAAAPTKAIFNVNNGTAVIKSDIQVVTNDTDLTNDVFAVNLAGGTLNMTNHNIGSFAAPVKTITLSGGSITNAAQIVGSTITIGNAAVALSGAPRLVIADGGTLDVSAVAPYTLASGLSVEGGGPTNVGTVNGSVIAGSGSTIAPGTTSAAGTLKFANDLALNGGSNLNFKLTSTPGAGNDLINVHRAGHRRADRQHLYHHELHRHAERQ